jgi:steroid delta-isomerase-like uncharacterized protein
MTMTRTIAALGGLRRLRAAWRDRQTRHHLAGLSDRQLKDIGLDRDDLGRLARGVRLDALMRERADALSDFTPDQTETTMTTAKSLANRLTVEKFLAGTHSNDLADLRVIDETVNEDIRCHGFPGFDASSREEYKAWFRFFQASFSNMAFEVTALVADEDHVAARWIVHADHTGDFAGIPATGQRITFDGVAVYRMRDGRISETWLHANETALMVGIRSAAEAA